MELEGSMTRISEKSWTAFENSPDWQASLASWIFPRNCSVCSRDRLFIAERGDLGERRVRGEYYKGKKKKNEVKILQLNEKQKSIFVG